MRHNLMSMVGVSEACLNTHYKHQQARSFRMRQESRRNLAFLGTTRTDDKCVVHPAEVPDGSRNTASKMSFRLPILNPDSFRRSFLFSLAVLSGLLFLSLPALCQESQESSSSNPAAGSTQNKPGDQSPSQNNSKDQSSGTPEATAKSKNDRMFYVMPNYLTVDNESEVRPVSWKQKFSMTAKGSFDPYEFAVVGVLSGIRQAENAYPAFGQGMQGYAQRYGTAFADQVDGNMMVGAVYPTILKTDPRYFQMGKGSFVHRFGYAISRIFVTRTDAGGRLFNIPEFLGNATAIGISNAYYPAADRGFSNSLNSWGAQMGIDAFGNELKEFWPDIHRHFTKNKNSAQP
jgi:hypothetical protein